jgi:uncharacterized protein (DUF58 family)
VKTQISPSLRAYVTAGLTGLAGALAVGHPAPAVLGAILLAIGIVGLAGRSALEATVELVGAPRLATEGSDFRLRARLTTSRPARRVYVDLPHDGVEFLEARGARLIGDHTLAFDSMTGVAEAEVTVRPLVWGHMQLGPPTIRIGSPMGMYEMTRTEALPHVISVMPTEARMRRLLAPLETNFHVGELVSTRRGPGTEFAEIRTYRHGDDPRWVNWRVSTRAGQLWVNDRHPERNGDVLLLVDAAVDTGTGLDVVIDRSVRMAAALVLAHSRRGHRLGLITTDGLTRWVYPGMGESHRRQILEQLISVTPGRVSWDAVERTVARVARRPAMVIVLTSLIEPGLAGIAHSMRRSGIDVSVIELDVTTLLSSPGDHNRDLGRRIWAMDQERLRDRLATEGIPITLWSPDDAPDVPIARLEQWRTSWRRRLG